MRVLPQMAYRIAEYSGLDAGKTEFARMCSKTAAAIGLEGRSKKFCDATILEMERGKYNDDERIQRVVRCTLSEYNLVPFHISDGILDALGEMDNVRLKAAAVLAETSDQNQWEPVLARASSTISPTMERFKRLEDQCRTAFPEDVALGSYAGKWVMTE
jgi:hypothetical protein